MLNFFKKISFLFKKPQVILIVGKGRSYVFQTVSQLLKSYSGKKKILIFESGLSEPGELKKFSFYLRKSRLPVLIVTHSSEVPPDKFFFNSDKEETLKTKKLAEILPTYGFLILNFDDETIREIKDETRANVLTYGFQERADLKASDINVDVKGSNFKINFEENIIPFWIKKLFGKEHIYSILAAVSLSKVNNINLVNVSQSFKDYKSFPGRMRLIKGIKNSLILDDSESATYFSMLGALKILGELEEIKGRKIAVLGDVLGIGKYSIEAHETIGEKVAEISDLLVTVGLRAKFIAQGARIKGMPDSNIFQFEEINKAKKYLQDIIKEGDLILVDGSKEMKMGEVIQEIKAYF